MAAVTLGQMTPKEKAGYLSGTGWGPTETSSFGIQRGMYVGTILGIPRLGLPALKMQDSSAGFRVIDRAMLGTMIVWPSMLAVASTWDAALVEAQATATAKEFLGKDANVILGPSINVHRIARGGRNFEYLSGEDPYLGSRFARAFVRGVQSQGVLAVVKHWAFNEQEINRTTESSVVGSRAAWELYYPPFQAAVEEGAMAFMCSYNKVNGTWACENAGILQHDLRHVMGFEGFVMSDWWAAKTASLDRGLDMDMPGTDAFFHEEALSSLPAMYVNTALMRVLTAVYRMGLDSRPGCLPPNCFQQQLTNVTTEAHRDLARRVATAAVILLKNKDFVLPLRASGAWTGRRLAIVGGASAAGPAPYGEESHPHSGLPAGDFYSGGGSGHIYAADNVVVTPLDGIGRRARAAGMEVLASPTNDPVSAVRVASLADVAIVVVGATTCENEDRANLSLADGGDDLIRAVAAGARKTIVLLEVPGAVLMPWRADVEAILCLFYGGQETGNAWAEVLFGDVAPTGKLPIMMPDSEADTIEPSRGDEALYAEGLFTSYRNKSFRAAYAFGHGLSYTTFSYSDARVVVLPEMVGVPGAVFVCGQGAHACATVTITNTGSNLGVEVPQAYLEFPAALGLPSLQLRGFGKTTQLRPGESSVAKFGFTLRDLSAYVPPNGWILQKHLVLHIGASSSDLRVAVPFCTDPPTTTHTRTETSNTITSTGIQSTTTTTTTTRTTVIVLPPVVPAGSTTTTSTTVALMSTATTNTTTTPTRITITTSTSTSSTTTSTSSTTLAGEGTQGNGHELGTAGGTSLVWRLGQLVLMCVIIYGVLACTGGIRREFFSVATRATTERQLRAMSAGLPVEIWDAEEMSEDLSSEHAASSMPLLGPL